MKRLIKKGDCSRIFDENRCPKCGKHLVFYNPFYREVPGVRPFEVSQEVECEECGWYLHYKYDISNIKVIDEKE